LSGAFGVQHLIGANGFRVGIGEQRKVNLAAVGERLQYLDAVIADGRQLEPLLFKSRFGVLQLDQLPFAVGSPVGGTKEKENRAVSSFQRSEVLLLAELVAGRESRRLPAHGESDVGEHLEGGDVKGIALDGSADGDAVTEMTNGLILRLEDE
jgi:hypothetical protein